MINENKLDEIIDNLEYEAYFNDCGYVNQEGTRFLEDTALELAKTTRALYLLLDWMIECDFGYDNIPDEYMDYKEDIEAQGLGYKEGLVYIAEKEAEKGDY